MTYHDGIDPPRQTDIFGGETPVDQLGLCTRDPDCTADADQHFDGCPVDERLREELGF